MTLAGAQAAVLRGTPYGDVYPLLPDRDKERLREWYLRAPVPNLKARQAKAPPAPSGGTCPQCQGFNMVRTGSCTTCQECGFNEGCG